jgi:DNA-binding NarL/FixJ family response regulator
MSKIRIVLIEDHDLSRIGLSTALKQNGNLEIVGEAANGQSGLKLITELKPDIALVDIGLPDIDGIELTKRLKQTEQQTDTSQVKVLILTMHKTEDSVLAAFAAGADSYALKDINLEELVQAIHLTNEGNAWIDPAIARIVLQKARQSSPVPESPETKAENSTTIAIESISPDAQKIIESYPLTEREMDVLELIVAGCNNAQIAEKLYITVGTVKTHVRNILNKLSVDDRTQAAVRALRAGLVG